MTGDLSESEDSLPGSQAMRLKPPANKPTMKDKQKMRTVCQICYTGDSLLEFDYNSDNLSQRRGVTVTHILEGHG